MKDVLCKAFCESLDVFSVPAGFAVRTPYTNIDGDPLLLYLVRADNGFWRIEDDGTQVALLEANGVDLGGKARGEAFQTLLLEHEAGFDSDTRTILTAAMSQSELGTKAVQFVSLLLRLQDLALLTPQIVRSTFREDAISAIKSTFSGTAKIAENAPIAPGMLGQEADIVITASGSPPLGIFLATSEENALHALVAKMEAEKYLGVDGKVALMVERAKNNPVKESTYALSLARLDGVVSFRESGNDAMMRLGSLIGLNNIQPPSKTLM